MTDEQFGTDPDLEIERDFFILHGHHYTCNGGNPTGPWHDHEVVLVRDGDVLRCPECGRTQPLKRRHSQEELDEIRRSIMERVNNLD